MQPTNRLQKQKRASYDGIIRIRLKGLGKIQSQLFKAPLQLYLLFSCDITIIHLFRALSIRF